MTFICKEELEAMLLKEMNIAHALACSEGIKDNQGNYKPKLFFFENCKNIIRCIPQLVYFENCV